MKLTSKQDIEAPLAFVFQQMSDFESWERAAMRRGAEVSRTDKLRSTGPGMTWLTRFRYKGRDRKLEIRLDRIDAPSHLVFTATSKLVDAEMVADLIELGAKRTRVHVSVDLKPKTLTAKLYVQTMRLARSRVEKTFGQRIGQMTTEIEERFLRPLRR
jgi:hypothetical protein